MKYFRYILILILKLVGKIIGVPMFYLLLPFRAYARNRVYNYVLQNKAKFEKEILIQKEPVIKASEKVKIENQKRGNIENNISDDFVITSF